MTTEQRDKNLNKGLSDYLECEKLLNNLFKEADFCFPNCISQPVGLHRERMDMPGDPTEFPGEIGCCPYNYFHRHNYPEIMDWSLLEKQRVERYREPLNHDSGCGYHSADGCVLKTHKSPICLAYICTPFSYYLSETYNIRYAHREVEEKLEMILVDRESAHGTQRFKQWLGAAIKRIQTKKGKSKSL